MSIFSFIVVVVVVLLSSVLTGDLIAHYTWSHLYLCSLFYCREGGLFLVKARPLFPGRLLSVL